MPEIYNSETQNNKTSNSENHKTETQTHEASPKTSVKRSSADYSEVMRNHKDTRNPLAAFMVRPSKAVLGIQQKDEKILMMLRRHFITNVGWIFIVIMMVVAPTFVSFLPQIPLLPERFNQALIVLWYLLTIGVCLEGFFSWYFNLFVITDERIIDIDFKNLIYKNVSAAKIDNLEDVTVQMGGAIRSILNFGTVFAQTAAEKTEFEFEDVPHPQEVAKLINELILEEQREELEGRVS